VFAGRYQSGVERALLRRGQTVRDHRRGARKLPTPQADVQDCKSANRGAPLSIPIWRLGN